MEFEAEKKVIKVLKELTRRLEEGEATIDDTFMLLVQLIEQGDLPDLQIRG